MEISEGFGLLYLNSQSTLLAFEDHLFFENEAA